MNSSMQLTESSVHRSIAAGVAGWPGHVWHVQGLTGHGVLSAIHDAVFSGICLLVYGWSDACWRVSQPDIEGLGGGINGGWAVAWT